MRRSVLGTLLVLLASRAAPALAQVAHDVGAPASDVVAGVVRLPETEALASRSQARIVPVAFESIGTAAPRWRAEIVLPVDRAGDVVLAVLGPDAGAWELGLALPEGGPSTRRVELVGELLPGWVVDRRDLADVPVGPLRVTLVTDRAPSVGWVVMRTASDLALEAWPSSPLLVADARPAVAARLSEPGAVVRAASVRFLSAGLRERVELQDDGNHADLAAGDGVYGALVPPAMRGDVFAEVEIAGVDARGAAFARSVPLAFPVVERPLLLSGAASARTEDDGRVRIELDAFALAPAAPLVVSAELWGRDAGGDPRPVCWLSRRMGAAELASGARDAGTWRLPLVLDPDWIAFAGALAPFELSAVRVTDPASGVVVATADRIALELPPVAARRVAAPTARMLCGREDATLGGAAGARDAGAHTLRSPSLWSPALMLVHGYCSSGTIWPPADFAQPKLEFLDPSANRTHDQFAQLIAQRAQQANLSSFGVVAHSQGGPASLHLLVHYQSGLDLATGGRRIQAVASPWLGTPLASLGGFACGVNNDMTPNGSGVWLAGIPSWARAEVSSWTTSNSGAVCNSLTNLFLQSPNDGTVEKVRAELPGGDNQGHTLGWCHTTGMSNPANYTDHARNQAMDAAAAR